jgi:GT2 family glycosyltransferase
MKPIALPDVTTPLVSVIMVTHGGGATAVQAIAALVEHTDPCYELIVVDNASHDDTLDQLRSSLTRATIIASTENKGFARGSNEGAQRAIGRFLCFLNPDAFVEAGWLSPLLGALDGHDTVGAAVPLFLHPDGRVQEAGSVVDSDGAALALGDGGEPGAFEYRFRRRVDYGSAACLLVRADLFREVGGFDPAYSPAYYEDVDLCFKLSERRIATVFEPRSRVVHLRGGGSAHANALMNANRRVFVGRWGERLAARRPLRAADTPGFQLAARDAEALDRILVVDDRIPHHDRGSGDPRMAKLLTELIDLWPDARVTLFAADPMNAERYAPPLLERGIEVAYADERFDQWLTHRSYHYSIVLVSRSSNIERFEHHLLRTQPQARRIYDIEALAFRRFEQRGDAAAAGLRELDRRGIEGADVIFCVSDEEADFAGELATGPVFVLPTYADALDVPPGFDERDGAVFFGGFLAGPGGPNEDAAVHLVEDVMPSVWNELPDLALEVVGANPTAAVRELQGPRVHVVGFVPDPIERLSHARVHIHPLRFGAGIKLKLIDTMAAGLPFVTTPTGAQGLGLGDFEKVVVADDPAELARRALALYRDRGLWEHVQAGFLDVLRTRFGRESFRRTLVEAFAHLGVAPPRRPLASQDEEREVAR